MSNLELFLNLTGVSVAKFKRTIHQMFLQKVDKSISMLVLIKILKIPQKVKLGIHQNTIANMDRE